MTVQELIENKGFEVVNLGERWKRKITTPFCCDLLSIAMGKAPTGCAWVTVMGNMNTLAVASLADVTCIVLAEGVGLDAASEQKAKVEGITVLKTEMSVFDAALKIYQLSNA